jgi:hypothetical protein
MHAFQPFAARTRPTSITTLDGSYLEYVDNYKYLGVWLNCKLSFQTHIKHLQSKIKSRIGFLFRNKASFTHAAKLTLVKLTILPTLDFGDVIYKIASNTLLSQLDAVYHSAIHFVTKSPYTTHHCDLYALVGWPPAGPRYIFFQTHWLQVIYKSMLGRKNSRNSPKYMCAKLITSYPRLGCNHCQGCFNKALSKGSEYLCKCDISSFYKTFLFFTVSALSL